MRVGPIQLESETNIRRGERDLETYNISKKIIPFRIFGR